jgi:hypothetical protein
VTFTLPRDEFLELAAFQKEAAFVFLFCELAQFCGNDAIIFEETMLKSSPMPRNPYSPRAKHSSVLSRSGPKPSRASFRAPFLVHQTEPLVH